MKGKLQLSRWYYLVMLLVPLGIFICSCFFCLACSWLVIVDEAGHMHLRGCYDWFRPPRTEYEVSLATRELDDAVQCGRSGWRATSAGRPGARPRRGACLANWAAIFWDIEHGR